MQVNAATVTSGPGPEVQIGSLLKHHTYDALGRLVRTQSPYPDPQTSTGQLRSERFYYDGVRRIQEVFVDPLDDMDEALGDPQGSSLVLQTVGSETDGAYPNAKIRRKTCGFSVML